MPDLWSPDWMKMWNIRVTSRAADFADCNNQFREWNYSLQCMNGDSREWHLLFDVQIEAFIERLPFLLQWYINVSFENFCSISLSFSGEYRALQILIIYFRDYVIISVYWLSWCSLLVIHNSPMRCYIKGCICQKTQFCFSDIRVGWMWS